MSPVEEPDRVSPGGALSRKMSTLARRDTAPEMTLRRELHRRGLRYRTQVKVPGNNRRTIDVAFTRARLAVYVDGCFWHGCPEHHVRPQANAEWWEWKIGRNIARDRSADAELSAAGWAVLRFWEHEDPVRAADTVVAARADRLARAGGQGPRSVGPMRAIGVTEYGGPEALHEVDLPAEPLGPGQVRVRVSASAVSPTDTALRSGAYSPGAGRADTVDVPGMDVAGTLVEVADDVDTGLSLGDPVVAIVVPSGEHGAYREDLVLPAGSVVAAPDGASVVEASTLPMNALTARMALEQLALAPGAVLAVTGAAGALGGYLVQLAKADGLTVVADAKDTDEDLVRTLGADVVVPRGADFADSVRADFPDGVDGLADASIQADEVTHAVRDGGGVATFRGWDGGGDTRLTYHPVLVRDGAERHDLLDRLRVQAGDGTLTLRVADVLPASEAVEAHRRLEAGGVRGRIVLDWR